MKPRTTLNFGYDGGIWPIVDNWAKDAHLHQEESTTFRRVYRRASLFTCPVLFDIVQEGLNVTVQAWVSRSKWTSPTWSLLIPPQMELGAPGIVAVVPRRLGRNVLNRLLTALNQSPMS